MGPRTVLVVEDDDDIRALTCLALETVAGWTVLEAPDGTIGLELARARLPEVVVLDMMMPGLSGLDVVECLRADARTRDIPVVLVTAKRPLAGRRAPWEGAAISGVIAKPYDPMTLGSQIDALLARAGMATS